MRRTFINELAEAMGIFVAASLIGVGVAITLIAAVG